MRKLYVEYDIVKSGGIIVASKNREATQKEIDKAKESHDNGKCNHGVFYDEEGWLYDIRICGICGAGLGLI